MIWVYLALAGIGIGVLIYLVRIGRIVLEYMRLDDGPED